ncbi:MAG: hypothetical protein MJ200_05175 [Mycoplasmoidaceae bacterium]|nr:hypothetical protein [Mycoplasmoidaceae bacterium]
MKDEKGNPANVFAYKNIQGEFDYNINDEFIKVQPDDKNGRLIIRLINPNDQSIVSTVDLNGFLKDDGYSDIIFPFGKIFCTMTGTATDNIQVEVLNPKIDTVLEYAVEEPSVATVTKTDTTGRTIKISGLVYGITKVNVALKDAAGMTLSTTEF